MIALHIPIFYAYPSFSLLICMFHPSDPGDPSIHEGAIMFMDQIPNLTVCQSIFVKITNQLLFRCE